VSPVTLPAASTALEPKAASSAGGKTFTFVRLPADNSAPIESQMGFDLPGGDTLPMVLSPLFMSTLKLDERTFKEQMAYAVEQAKATAAQQGKGGLADGAAGPNAAPSARRDRTRALSPHANIPCADLH
jgi:hypothetical protein